MNRAARAQTPLRIKLKSNAINAPGSASSRKEANSAAFWRNANSAICAVAL